MHLKFSKSSIALAWLHQNEVSSYDKFALLYVVEEGSTSKTCWHVPCVLCKSSDWCPDSSWLAQALNLASLI